MILSEKYNDKELLTFIRDLQSSDAYIQGFEKTVTLARKRNVPKDEILSNKAEIDNYFMGDNKNG